MFWLVWPYKSLVPWFKPYIKVRHLFKAKDYIMVL
jgi:hypothetical protein